MRCTRLIIVLSCAVFFGTQTVRSDDASFIGPDLKGWEGLMEYWTYKDGAVVGATPKGLKFNTFLCSKKKYGDFEMSFQVRLKDGAGNSGVQIRSKIINPERFAVGGPQCDMGAVYWGSLYGEAFGGMMKQAPTDVVKKVLKPKDFNDYHIRCVGKHVTIKLNGQVTVDDDFPKMPKEGIIAFQLHAGGPMEVTYRHIQFKEIAKAKKSAERLPMPKEAAPTVQRPVQRKTTSTPPAPAAKTLPPGEKAPAAATQQPSGTIASEPQPEIYEVPVRRGPLMRLLQRLRR